MKKKKAQRHRAQAKERRRVYAVERLPVDARELVWDGYAEGKAYEEIRAALEKRGIKISMGALSNYWRDQWRFEEDRVRMARAVAERIAWAMSRVGKTPLAVVGRELLFTKVFEKLKELDEATIWQLLKEGRELAKVTRGQPLKAEGQKGKLSAVEEAREIRRRWRRLYGLEEGDEKKERAAQG